MRSDTLRRHWLLLILFAAAFAWRIVGLFDAHEIWWDAGVYIGMGKWIWSAGTAGLWEHIRPPGLPILLGMVWMLGLDPVFWGRLVEVAFSMGAGALIYLLCREWFGERPALLAATLWLFSPIVGYMGFHHYTEIPAAFFAVLAILFALRGRPFWAGMCIGAAFLMKFPAGMFLLPVLAVFALRKEWMRVVAALAGFLAPVGPFLAANAGYAGSMLGPLSDASAVIRDVLGCNVLRAEPWWHYFSVLLTSEAWGVHALALLGIITVWRMGWRRALVPLLCAALPLAYHIHLPCREYRYLVLFLPFACMLTAAGIARAVDSLERIVRRRKGAAIAKRVFPIAALLLLWFAAHVTTRFYLGNEQPVHPAGASGYFGYLAGKSAAGEVWTSNPTVAAYTDAVLHKIYYPVYHRGESTRFAAYLREHPERIGAVFLDNCGGGLICAEGDTRCAAETQDIIDTLTDRFALVYDAQFGRCWYKVFEKPTS